MNGGCKLQSLHGYSLTNGWTQTADDIGRASLLVAPKNEQERVMSPATTLSLYPRSRVSSHITDILRLPVFRA
jgi:hypothetical protein